jgi:hypothetical protein
MGAKKHDPVAGVMSGAICRASRYGWQGFTPSNSSEA